MPTDFIEENHRPLLRTALLIRRFEERLLSLFSEGKLNGTVHTCIGQEWVGVALAAALKKGDHVFSTHRGHGHFLARHPNPKGLFAEIMGRADGVCGGVGGSQHLCAEGFLSSGIQGGMVPVATGVALAGKLDASSAITAIFIGDGTLGEGALYESLNIASRWDAPLLVVVENNRYAQSTSAAQTTAGSIAARAAAFGIEYRGSDTWQWRKLLADAAEAVSFVRSEQRPLVLEIETYRLKAHSKGDDNRDPKEIREHEERDPLNLILAERRAHPWLDKLVTEVEREIEAAASDALRSELCRFKPKPLTSARAVSWAPQSFEPRRVSDLIHEALKKEFERREKLVLIGEDIEGHYGGAFKITRDLSERHPGRVRNTPISESAITGVGSGLALGGKLAMVEIMFGDFLTLTFDQLLQHACKFAEMYNHQVTVPLIVRTPMGGKRGYGPTHSQSLEKHYLGMPGLQVLALNSRLSPALVYERLFDSIDGPTLVIENKILYTRFLATEPIPGFSVSFSDERFPCVRIGPRDARPDLTVVCYGGNLEDAEKAVQNAFDHDEILCEILCPTSLQPLNIAPIAESVAKSGRLLTIEEGADIAGFGTEVLARLNEERVPVRAFARMGHNALIPACLPLELALLPNPDSILARIREVARA